VLVDPEIRVAPDALPALARKLLGVSPDCIRMWRHRGHLVPGDDGRYRLGDVLAVNGSMRRSPNSRRKVAA
jgi:hypothetical protein